MRPARERLERLERLRVLPLEPQRPRSVVRRVRPSGKETLRLLDDIIWQKNSDMREFYTANYTFVNADLAGLYGVTAPASVAVPRRSAPTAGWS